MITKRTRRGRNIHVLHRVLAALDGGESKPTNIWNASRMDHGRFSRFTRRLEEEGLIRIRPVTEEEHRADKRARVRMEITEAGKRFLRDLEAMDRRVGGLLLEL